jgi:hypothetical protein
LDRFLLEAMEEVDAMLPDTPPIAQPRPAPTPFRYMGLPLSGARIVGEDRFGDLVLSDGSTVDRLSFEDLIGPR